MRILLLFSFIVLLYNCSSIKVAKEVTKATQSIKISVKNIVTVSEIDSSKKIIKKTEDNKKTIAKEMDNLKREKENEKEIIIEQKKKTKINLLDKTSNEIELIIGKPKLIRIDGNSKTVRFDNDLCQLFLFLDSKVKNAKIEYFEIRNKKGQLIINKEKIEKCYNAFNLI